MTTKRLAKRFLPHGKETFLSNLDLYHITSTVSKMRKKMVLRFLMIPLILSLFTVYTIEVTLAQATHDIAVVSVTPDPTLVELGELVNITVVVENQGTENETFDVTVCYDTTTIETQNVSSLTAGANTSLTFVWNTTDVWPLDKPYAINATASIVPGETDTADNKLVSLDRVRVFRSPYIAVVPHSTVNPNLTIGMSYTVSIYTDYNGSDITGYQFSLSYDPAVLHGVNVTNGDLITPDKDTSAMFMPGEFDNTAGKLTLTGAGFLVLEEPVPITSGPGTLANVTFEVVGEGESRITIGTEVALPSVLFGYTEGGYGNEYEIVDASTNFESAVGHGYFRNTLAELIRDVAVINVALNTTEVEIGELVDIAVVVENQGTVSEDVTVNLYYRNEAGGEDWPIETKSVSRLAAGTSTSLMFTWDTTDTVGVPSNYVITAEAEPVSGETDTVDNTRESEEMVTVRAEPEYPIRLELIIGIAVAVVAVVASVTFALRRGKKPIPE